MDYSFNEVFNSNCLQDGPEILFVFIFVLVCTQFKICTGIQTIKKATLSVFNMRPKSSHSVFSFFPDIFRVLNVQLVSPG